mgnify:FL=1
MRGILEALRTTHNAPSLSPIYRARLYGTCSGSAARRLSTATNAYVFAVTNGPMFVPIDKVGRLSLRPPA